MSTHTPTPWTYHKHGNRDWIEDANTDIVVEAVGHLDGPFICEAINNHDRLTAEVARLREALTLVHNGIKAKRIKCAPVISFGLETAELQTVEEIVAKAINPEEPK